MSDLKTLFLNPPARYRGTPFWSWNDRLEVSELVRQVNDMRAHGMGGVFMHSREGLETVYMGPEWLNCIRETVRAARQAGAYAWLYDEDRWPSGAAGGLVPARGGDAFRAKAITMERATHYTPAGDVLAVFRAVVDGQRLLQARREQTETALTAAPGETLLIFRRTLAAPSEWFNNDAPADNLNPDSVAAFIDITYETYYREVGDEFGKTVPGIFTDEPNFGTDRISGDLPRIPWTDGLDDYFTTRRGYDLFDVLPYIFLVGAQTAKARHDYWWTISERYTTAYSRQIGEWCEAHHLAFTGHYLLENDLGNATVCAGAIMPHYQYQQVPGIDILTIQNHENLTVKQCTSVAHQFGREFVLSETYGCAGWEMTFEDQKWSGDWQYVLGVSLRCQHLALYSLRGCRKRDYPPSFNYNTTWWKYNHVVEDYFARVGLLTTQGRAVRDLLVLHPAATAWMMVGQGRRSSPDLAAANAFGESLNDFTRVVLATHYDFDFGDEQIMAEWARVTPGEAGPTLWVNQAPYKVVIIPPGTQTLLPSTVSRLEEFLAAGGRVIAFDPPPTMIAAVAEARLAALFAQPGVVILTDVSALPAALERVVPRRVSILDSYGREAESFLYMQRTATDAAGNPYGIFFIVNSDRHRSQRVCLTLEGRGRLEEWNLLTGETQPVPVIVQDGAVRFEANFGPAGSRLYVFDPTQPPVVRSTPVALLPGRGQQWRRTTWGAIGPVCRFRRTEPNALTLDVCRYRIRRQPWSDPMPVWQAQRAIREQLGMRQVYYNGLPQRYKWVNQPHPQDGTPVAFQFNFTVQDVPATPVDLVVEGAEDFAIRLNGRPVSNQATGWYLDRAFDRVTLPPLRRGVNTLTLTCAYQNRMEVEDCYLIGDFGVDTRRVIIREPDTLYFGDWCLQGYLHYAGSLIYLETLNYDPARDGRLALVLNDYSAITIAIRVNGQVVGHIPWRSENSFELTPHLRPGDNEIGIEVVGSPRNLLGPLHRRRGYEPWTDWASFRTEGANYTPEYVLQPYGLIGPVHIVTI